MRVFTSTRGSALATLLLFGLGACGESTTAPVPFSAESADLLEAAEPLMSARGDDSDSDSDVHVAYSGSGRVKHGSRKFTIRPGKSVRKKLGDYQLSIPAGVVCDPATSGYGPSYWNAPCRSLNRPLAVTAEWVTVDGNQFIRFRPAIRFAPSSNPRNWVILSAKPDGAFDPLKNYAILWRDPVTQTWVDESATDPSLKAQLDPRTNRVLRRLKHFSDYYLWSGFGSYNVTSGFKEDVFEMEAW
jgi:hypothetical protein